jgi:prolyl-tRNA synthetase
MFHTSEQNEKQKKHTNNEKNTNNHHCKKTFHSKQDDFWQWFLWILETARIVDTDYSVKGSYIWLDYGFLLFERLSNLAAAAYRQLGHHQMQFPLLIKEKTFNKESSFIRNFEDDVFWVDREGKKDLIAGERLALRPTSELVIYPSFARWIRSWRDLPLKIFQNVSIFRCETNETKPLIRNRETIGFIEGHSAFTSEEEARLFLQQVWKMYTALFQKLGIPIVLVEVPEWDRFAGSSLTVDGYVLFPESKAMELFTTAYLGTTFSEIFDIIYLDENMDKQLAHLLCYGPSIDRILASIISLYGDDNGLILLPEITPYDFIIVPIFTQENMTTIFDYTQEVFDKLSSLGFKGKLDDNKLTTPGTKFYEAERLGIPLRIELGQKELQTNQITITRRDTFKKTQYSLNDNQLKEKIEHLLQQISASLRKRIYTEFQDNILEVHTYQELELLTRDDQLKYNQLYLFGWCGSKDCCEKIESTTSFNLLGFHLEKKNCKTNCIICGKEGHIAILAKRY